MPVDLTKLTLVIWDLDGTLIDSYGIYKTVMQEAATLSGLTMPSDAALQHNFHGSLDESIKNAFDMVDDDNFAILLNDFLRIQEDYYHQPEDHLFADARELASAFASRGLTQIVVTNREHAGRGNASPRYLVEQSSLRDKISAVVCADEVVQRKPAASVLADVAVAQNILPEQMIVIGDQYVDAQLAHNLGAAAVIVNRGDGPVPHLETLEKAVVVVRSLTELIAQL